MRITIDFRRTQKGNAHSPCRIRAFYDTHPDDDIPLHNGGVDLYNMICEGLRASITGKAVLEDEGLRHS